MSGLSSENFGFRLEDSDLRAWGSYFRVNGFGVKVEGWWFRASREHIGLPTPKTANNLVFRQSRTPRSIDFDGSSNSVEQVPTDYCTKRGT